MKKVILFSSALIAVMFLFFYQGLFVNQHVLTSNLIGKPLPELHASSLNAQKVSTSSIKGPYVLNIFASWCDTCRHEHDFWVEQSDHYQIIGIAYKDQTQKLQKWLKLYGNPYKLLLVDQNGMQSMRLGVYGTPETYVIDQKGIVRYRHVGAMSKYVWQHKILPILELKS